MCFRVPSNKYRPLLAASPVCSSRFLWFVNQRLDSPPLNRRGWLECDKKNVHTVLFAEICDLVSWKPESPIHLHNLDIDFVANMKKIGGNNMYREPICPLFWGFKEPFKRRPKFHSKQPGHQRVPGEYTDFVP